MIARNAAVSIYGLYLWDPHLFDDFACPTGLDKDLLVDNLVMECTELELLYPDGDFMKKAMKLWSTRELDVWQHMVDTMALDYNPLYNKDATFVDDRTVTTAGTTSGTSTSVDQASAYNEDGFHNAAKNDGTTAGMTIGTTTDHSEHREYGNIGVTTSQQMVKEELKLREFCVYDYIIKSFKQRFCLLLY